MLRKPRRARQFERAVEAPCAFWAYVDAHQRVDGQSTHTDLPSQGVAADHWLISCALVRSAGSRTRQSEFSQLGLSRP